MLCTHPSSVLFVQSALLPHTPHPPSPAWVMACVDFLSLWEVVLHGLPLSSCFHACPFNRLGNPSWYLYRPWFSWYHCSLPSSPFASPLQSISPSLCFCLLYLQSLPTLSLRFPDNVFILSSVNIFQFIFTITFPHPKNPSSSETVRIPLNSDQS